MSAPLFNHDIHMGEFTLEGRHHLIDKLLGSARAILQTRFLQAMSPIRCGIGKLADSVAWNEGKGHRSSRSCETITSIHVQGLFTHSCSFALGTFSRAGGGGGGCVVTGEASTHLRWAAGSKNWTDTHRVAAVSHDDTCALP